MITSLCFRLYEFLRYMSFVLLMPILGVYRRWVLHRIVFVGITGSCGKTTTKELVAAILATRFKGKKSRETRNTAVEVVRTLLRLRRSDTYCVQELSATKIYGRSSLDRVVKMLQPKIGVVTNIGTDHLRMFGSKQAIAAAKGELVAGLPGEGTAVLNADDPLVLDMARRCRGLVVTYGTGPNAMLRAQDVRSSWPDRLTFTVQWGDTSHLIQTQLCGTHWVHCVLAALAVGLSLGIPLEVAAEAIKAAPPFPGRMSPQELSPGVTLIRDDWKASFPSFPPALEFVEQARALRKIMVVGTISDYGGSSKPKYLQIARQAQAKADYVFFVGPWAPHGLAAKQHADDASVQAFANVKQAAERLKALLQPGDLVLTKGSQVDRLWSLTRLLKSNGNGQLHTPPANGQSKLAAATNGRAHVSAPSRPAKTDSALQLVVGLGNPEARLKNTRHNVGHRVVDALAARMGARWQREDQAMVAHLEVQGRPVCLVKLLTSMNTSGDALQRLSEQLEFEAPDCLLVHDDIDLPVGKVRERMRGSAGGHNGVLSILTAYQSEEFRRVKIGVGQPPDKKRVASFVLSSFPAEEEPVMRGAVEGACSSILRLLANHRVHANGSH